VELSQALTHRGEQEIIPGMERLCLASTSPRRIELLLDQGFSFDCISPEIDESLRDCLEPAQRVLALSEDKARAVASSRSSLAHDFILAADTLVCLPRAAPKGAELALGKPRDLEDARRMIRLLSGASHIVRTGVSVLACNSGELFSARSDSTVSFAPMSDFEIDAYLSAGEWEGVAGGYRIQGRAAFYIDSLEGSWSGVVGLPIHEVYVILLRAGYRYPPVKADTGR
jgi:septum formation protein